jgi:hypothetical protein
MLSMTLLLAGTGGCHRNAAIEAFITSSYFLSASSARKRASFSWFSRASMRSSSCKLLFSRTLRLLQNIVYQMSDPKVHPATEITCVIAELCNLEDAQHFPAVSYSLQLRPTTLDKKKQFQRLAKALLPLHIFYLLPRQLIWLVITELQELPPCHLPYLSCFPKPSVSYKHEDRHETQNYGLLSKPILIHPSWTNTNCAQSPLYQNCKSTIPD